MITFSAFSDEVSQNFSEQVKFLVSENIGYMEIRFVNGQNIMDLNKSELVEAKKLLDDNGISISAIGSPIGKETLDKPFDPHFDKYKHAVELAEFFNSPFIRVFSYYAPDGKSIDDCRDEVINRMSKKAAFLNGSEIVLVHENESHIFGHSAENCVDIVESVGSSNLKLAYDPANFVWGQNIANNFDVCWKLMKPHVVHVHIKDWKLGSKDVGSLPGEGDGQITELLSELKNMNYIGFITMEPHLRLGGQFGGESGPELFSLAISETRKICENIGINFN